MTAIVRTIAALSLVLVAGLALGVNTASAQSVSASDAQAFLGLWAVSVDAQGQTLVMDLDIKNEGGNVAAEVNSQLGRSQVERITRNGDKLVLSYSVNAQGQQVPVVMTLAAADAGLNADLDFAGGMFVASGKGTKK
jgi:hypothetical protein